MNEVIQCRSTMGNTTLLHRNIRVGRWSGSTCEVPKYPANELVGLRYAAISNAVIAGINAKNAICLVFIDKTTKADGHRMQSRS